MAALGKLQQAARGSQTQPGPVVSTEAAREKKNSFNVLPEVASHTFEVNRSFPPLSLHLSQAH